MDLVESPAAATQATVTPRGTRPLPTTTIPLRRLAPSAALHFVQDDPHRRCQYFNRLLRSEPTAAQSGSGDGSGDISRPTTLTRRIRIERARLKPNIVDRTPAFSEHRSPSNAVLPAFQ